MPDSVLHPMPRLMWEWVLDSRCGENDEGGGGENDEVGGGENYHGLAKATHEDENGLIP